MASVVNQDPSTSLCTWSPSPIDVGDRYMEATAMLGGVVVDICDTDWSPGVTDATHSIEPYEELRLTHDAEVDSIRVFIDGFLNSDLKHQKHLKQKNGTQIGRRSKHTGAPNPRYLQRARPRQ